MDLASEARAGRQVSRDPIRQLLFGKVAGSELHRGRDAIGVGRDQLAAVQFQEQFGQAERRIPGLARSNTSAMRVCQPGPDAFQLAMTSGGKRIESSFLGFSSLGRPRRTSCLPW